MSNQRNAAFATDRPPTSERRSDPDVVVLSTLSPAAEARAQGVLAQRTDILLTEAEMDARVAAYRASKR